MKATIVKNDEFRTERWRAEKGGIYYYIRSCGRIVSSIDEHQYPDDYMYNTGNYFKTEEEAKESNI